MQKRELVRGRLSRLLSQAGADRRMSGELSDGGPMMEQFESRVLMDAVFWDGGAGTNSWHDAANWNRNGLDAVPVNGDDVTINVAANPTVTFSTGSVTLNSLVTNEALTVTGGTLGMTGAADVNATLTVNGGTLSGGAWDVTGGSLHAGTSGGNLTDTQITGDILLDVTSASVRVGGTTRFGAARLTSNAANLQFAPGYTLSDLVVAEGATAGTRTVQGAVGGTGTLTIAPSGVIRLAASSGGNLNVSNSSAMTLINNGLISAEATGRTLTINNSTLTNNATVQATAGTLAVSPTNFTNSGSTTATGATLSIDGNWTNPGTISTTNGTLTLGGTWSSASPITVNNSTLTLGGTFNIVGLTINRTGGTVNLTGTMNNTANTFTFNATTGSWNLMGGTITGGALNFSGSDRLVLTSSGGNLTDVQVNGDLLLDATSANVKLGGTTRFTAARLTANAANLQFAPGYTLSDLVVAEGATAGTRTVQGAVGGTGTLTIAPSGVIRLAASSGGNLNVSNSSVLTLTNNGLISAEAAGRTLTINNSTLINNTTIQATAGTLTISPTNFTNAGSTTATDSTLGIDGNWTNPGTVTVTNGTLTLGGTWSSATALNVTNTTLNLGGTFNIVGLTINRTGGTVNLTGTMNNTGNTFTFNATTGSWNLLAGTITGGTLNFSGSDRLVMTSSGGVLTDVQVNGELLLDTTSSRVRVGGTTRFTAARMSANAANIEFAPGYTLMDLVVGEGAAAGTRSIQGAVGGTGTLTIAPSGIIRLAAGSGGNLNISNSSVMTLINNGLISAEAAGRTLTINNSTFTNNAAIQSIAGTLAVSPTNWTNAGTATATDATLTLEGTWSNPGTITASNATLNLGGTFTAPGVGSLSRTGGAVNLTGTMNNASNTFMFNATIGPWNLLGGGITGGTVNFSGTDRLVMTTSDGILTDVQVNGDLLLDVTSARVRVAGTTRFTAARMTANASNLEFAPGYVLMDLVVAEGVAAGTRSVQGAVGGTGTLTIAPSGVIRLAAGSGGNLNVSNSSVLTLINNGLISAEATGRTLTINNSTFTNNTTIQATAGTLTVSPTNWTNVGTATATDGTLSLEGTWSNPGTITATNATVNLGGTFTALGVGTFSRTGGTVNLVGTMNNSSNTFTFNSTIGSWNLMGGTITGGTVNFSGTDRLVMTNSAGTLTDVQVNGDLLLDTTSARLRAGGTTRFTSVRMTANASNLEFAPGYVLMDLVVAEGVAAGTRSIQGAVGGTGTLTIGPTGVIRLAAGCGGNLSISNSSVATLINNGLITAEATGRTLTISTTTLTNNGTVQALAGTFSVAPSNFTNYAAGVLTGGTFNAFGSGIMAMPAGTVIVTNNATVGVGSALNFAAVATLNTNNGTLQTGGGGTFTITPDGGTLTNNGTVRLAPVNLLTIAGNYFQAPTATMIVEIQGSGPTDIGRLSVTGTATLNGQCTVVAVNNYQPACVNQPFISAGTLVGEFDTQTLPLPPTDHQVFLVYIGGEVRFAISPPSDFNRDGILNSQDLFDFLVEFFNQTQASDFNHDGILNSQDFFDFITDFFEGCG